MAILTLFEMTTQHGFVGSVVNQLIRAQQRNPKHYTIEFVAARPSGARFMRLYYIPRSLDKPIAVYPIREREQMESKDMWQRSVEKELTKLWKDLFGPRTEAEPDSPTSPPTASSTDAPPVSETSPSKSEAAVSESTAPDPSPPPPAQSKPSETSSKPSKRPYKRKAKSSPS